MSISQSKFNGKRKEKPSMPSTPSPPTNPSSTVNQPITNFTGTAYFDNHVDPTTAANIQSNHPSSQASLATVTFTPSARTHWHVHESGQLIQVRSGTGWVCDRGDTRARKIQAGDTVWCSAGTEHWHGAAEGSVMSHFVVSLGGMTWGEAVGDEEYKALCQ